MLNVNCQSSIKITGDKVIYFDPLKVAETHDADYIFITHTHWDHFSLENIQKIRKESTKIIGPKDIKSDLKTLNIKEENIITTTPNQELLLDNIKIKTQPAYNTNKSFHPRENAWLGFVITIENITYYIMGDTDALTENENIKCDVLCIPIGGTYTMDAKEAADFTNKLNPKTVIPIHYGLVVGTQEDLNIFKSNINPSIQIEEKINLQ